jgi:hypothetical protein
MEVSAKNDSPCNAARKQDPLVEIDEVRIEPNAPGETFRLDAPTGGARSDIYALQLHGAIGTRQKLEAVAITSQGRLLRFLPLHGVPIERSTPLRRAAARIAPGNTLESSRRDPMLITDFLHWIGHNPYYDFPEMARPGFAHWCGRESVEASADFCRANIEACYRSIAADEAGRWALDGVLDHERSSARYFTEKAGPLTGPELFWELYPQMREIILVRDPRDLLASILAFNAKRGFQAFGRSAVKNDHTYIVVLRERMRQIQRAVEARTPRAYFLRYEDLIRQPHETLRALLEYLDLDAAPATVEKVLQRAGEDTAELKFHRTSAGPRESIGRWRRDLSPKLQALCQRELGEVLAPLGYED